jgi:hypothetical protein
MLKDHEMCCNLSSQYFDIIRKNEGTLKLKTRKKIPKILTIEETKDDLYYRNGLYVLFGESVSEKEAKRVYQYNLCNRHLSEIKGHITRSIYHTRDEIHSDLNIINLKNGL